MNYHIVRKIGEGGFSEIFEVRDPHSALHESLILKRLTSEMSARPEVRTAFTQEGEILSNLRHPNVVTFRRCYYDQEQICLVMEKIDGVDFMTWVRRHRDRPAIVLDAFRQVLEAVDYLHHRSQPLLHLDLKPENVLISVTAGEAKPVLIDFGIARGAGGPGLKAYTPEYAAPEQQRGGRLGCYTDVYSLGQILDELLREIRSSLDPMSLQAFRSVADRSRSTSRGRRYGEAGEMLSAFRAARASSREPVSTQVPAVSPKLLLVAGSATLALAMIVLILVVMNRVDGGGEVTHQDGEADPEPQLAVVSELSGCFQLESVGGTGNLEAFGQGVDVCIEEALQSNQISMMNERYVALSNLLQESRLDAGAEAAMARKLDEFRREIDIRTVSFGDR